MASHSVRLVGQAFEEVSSSVSAADDILTASPELVEGRPAGRRDVLRQAQH